MSPGNGPGGVRIEIPPMLAGAGVLVLVGVVFLIALFLTGITVVDTGEVAVIMNNVTGRPRLKLTNGTVVHWPFGIAAVYKLDKHRQMIQMTGRPDRGDRAGDDSVQVKTNDGSNVNVDVEIQYEIIPERAAEIVQRVGRGDAYRGGIVRAYARSILRDELGRLSVVDIADPTHRDMKTTQVRARMNEQLDPYGLRVVLVTATNPVFNPEYEKMIKQRKEADQETRNERSAQETAREEQKRSIADAEREKNVAIRKFEGEMNARTIAARADAEQAVRRNEGAAYAIRKEGEQALAQARNEAAAIEAEGLARAKAVEELARAYEEGGLALVREALAEKYAGVVMQGRPYSLASEVDRLRLEHAGAALQGGK
jgi:regulator of protease activity HflC (stomatin/prohibitin superfamily)